MLAVISEELVLHRAIERGLLSPQDLAAVPVPLPFSAAPRFGATLDSLIAQGRLTVETVEQLCAELSMERVGHDQTLAQSSISPSLGPSPAPIAHALTQDSAVVRQPVTIASSTGFPVPNWDKYEFLDLLGRGGMGAVYRARDRRLDRIVALKFLHGNNPGQVQRFMQEARAQARLDHPHICKVFEVGVVEGKPYIAMQLVHGLPLDRASRVMTLLEKVQVCKDAAEAMHFAHEQGIIHRDVKPSNILVGRSVGPDGGVRYEPVVMDFGLARDSSGSGLTESGDVLGTPAYMSPEQARGETRRMDRRTDVYSLGATLYDVLVGQPPFDDETVVNIILRVISEAPRPLRSVDAELPEALELIVAKCLNKEAEQRYPTAKALADDLGRFLTAKRVEARRLGYVYRLGYFARHNKALAAVGLGLLISLLGLLGFGTYARVMDLRKERLAKEETLLAQKLGQSVKDLEWLARTSHLLPLHDTRREKQLVRERMDEITADLKRTGSASAERLGAYVLGRGHLALHEWDAAQLHLARAAALGYRDPELDFATGRVLGERYSRAIEEARRSGDKGFFEKRRQELAAELLVPARDHLSSARKLRTVSTSYIEALIDFYNQHYDAALINAEMAHAREPWLYEAKKLQGDVHMSRALEARDRGDNTQAERHFADAVARYEEAAAIGHSDRQVHEAAAEAWLRQEEMDLYRGVNPEPKLRRAIEAADRALEAAPADSSGHIKKAFATYFQAQYAQMHGSSAESIRLYEDAVAMAKRGVELFPQDAYAREIAGLSYARIAEINKDLRSPVEDSLKSAYDDFESALKINPRFPWAYNDYGVALGVHAEWLIAHNKNPEEILHRMVKAATRAIELDENYLFARVTLGSAYYYMARWGMEHGRVPDETASQGALAMQAVININKELAPIYGNLGQFFLIIAAYDADRNSAEKEHVEKAISAYKKMIEIDGNMSLAYRYLASAYALKARHELLRSEDPLPAVQLGLAATETCLRTSPGEGECRGVQGQLQLLWALRDRRRGQQVLSRLEQARVLGRQALAATKDNEEMLLIMAELCFESASALSAERRPAAAVVEEGLGAAERALALAVGWPRALALRGALLVLRSRGQTGEERLRSLSLAQQSLGESFAENALLRNRFGVWKDEAEKESLTR